MHPVIRILTLLMGVVMVVLGGWTEWLFALLSITVLVMLVDEIKLQPMVRMVVRLRWLMFSIILIYLSFTPGDPLLPALASSSPSWQGLAMGGYRAAVLLLMVIAVSVILQSTSKEQLIAALLWLFTPFAKLGFSLERLAVRLVLTMEAVDSLQSINRSVAEPAPGMVMRIRAIAVEMVDLFDHVTHHAHSLPCQDIEVPILAAPDWRQWLALIVLSGVFLLL